jgi:hypothetical protein
VERGKIPRFLHNPDDFVQAFIREVWPDLDFADLQDLATLLREQGIKYTHMTVDSSVTYIGEQRACDFLILNYISQ